MVVLAQCFEADHRFDEIRFTMEGLVSFSTRARACTRPGVLGSTWQPHDTMRQAVAWCGTTTVPQVVVVVAAFEATAMATHVYNISIRVCMHVLV